ncbi:MAG TPA: NUDIX domain-containing protein [Pilimelia sp.]|nr:NUDIX domain-containing protein [Pilimelia sp.]
MTETFAALAAALDAYEPRTVAEAADLARARALLHAGRPWDRDTPLHVTVSALVVHPPTGRVLLRWHPRQRAWLQVGGHADPGEADPLAVALREAAEETGLPDLVAWPGDAPVQLAVVPVNAAGAEPAHEHADLRYVLATAQPDAARPENPAAELRWLSLPAARELTTEPNVRELLARAAAPLQAARL